MFHNYIYFQTVTPTKPASGERELHDEIKRLENEVKEKDSAINDLNEKLMERLKECQVLREENEAVKESLDLSNEVRSMHAVVLFNPRPSVY